MSVPPDGAPLVCPPDESVADECVVRDEPGQLKLLHDLDSSNTYFRVQRDYRKLANPLTSVFAGGLCRPLYRLVPVNGIGFLSWHDVGRLVQFADQMSNKQFTEILVSRYEKRCRDQGCAQEKDTMQAEEAGVQQQQRYSLLEQEMLYNSLPNKKHPNGALSSEELLNSMRGLLGVESIDQVTPELILEMCKKCSVSSKCILKLLPELPAECLDKLKHKLQADLLKNMLQENTCYLVRYFIKTDTALSRKCNMMVFLKLEEMMNQQHTCRLVYTLCSTSASFREDLSIRFKMEFSKFIETLPGAILISHLVLSTPDLENVSFIYDELVHNPEVVKSKYFGRAFATFMGRCSEETLTKIADLLSKHISFLLQNNYGNYLLQIFFERKNKPGMDLCKKALKKAHKKVFLRKYSRFVLLKAILLDDAASGFSTEISELVCKDAAVIRSIIIKRLPGDMLLLCLAKMANKPGAADLLTSLESVCNQDCAALSPPEVLLEFRKELSLLRTCLANWTKQ